MPETKDYTHLNSPLRLHLSNNKQTPFYDWLFVCVCSKSDALVLILMPNSSPGQDSFKNGKLLRLTTHIFNWAILWIKKYEKDELDKGHLIGNLSCMDMARIRGTIVICLKFYIDSVSLDTWLCLIKKSGA